MIRWEFLESVRFWYSLRNTPEHPALVEEAKGIIEQIPHERRRPTLDKVLVLAAGDFEDPLYKLAFADLPYYQGMSTAQLKEYACYLIQTFDFSPAKKKLQLPNGQPS